jgi:DNA mismatch repair ATPase MutS
MKAFLMYRDRDLDLRNELPLHAAELVRDLEMDTLFQAMSDGDAFLLEVVRKTLLLSLKQPEEIRYRQQVLTDCLEQAGIVREMYAIAVEAIEREKRVWGSIFGRYPDSLLNRSVEVLQIFVTLLKRLRRITDDQRAVFRSEGFTRFFDMIAQELDDQYLANVDDHLRRLAFKTGILLSAELGKGNKGTHYVLRTTRNAKQGWRERLEKWMERLSSGERSTFVYQVADRDENGLRALSELKGQGISQVAIALAESTDHILSFFKMLRLELGFYVGCLNLRDKLVTKGEPICLSEPLTAGSNVLWSRGLYDVCLSLSTADRTVGNDVNADGKALVMVTGANRGGKSTLLRSLGLSQLMMQCGMFSPAQYVRASICDGVYTHFRREEDASMHSGKLDEELSRMSSLVDALTPNSLVLLNESFSSTNEREGSEIARQIVGALLESGIKVCYVTHMFDLAIGFYLKRADGALFLRAERLAAGQRTFRLAVAGPLPTSYGEDLYRRIFGAVQEQ